MNSAMINDDVTMETNKINNSPYGFSSVAIGDLGATEYTLVVIAVDVSDSTGPFRKDMQKCITQIVNSCKDSPRKDNLLIRILTFDDVVKELHGFVELPTILDRLDKDSDYYSTILRKNSRGMTAIYDAGVNGIASARLHSSRLVDNDFDANGIFFLLTDGLENASSNSNLNDLKKENETAKTSEELESFTSILVGVNTNGGQVTQYLTQLKDDASFDQYIDLEKADEKSLAKLAKFVSQSISSKSNSLGSKSAAPAITW